MASIVCTARILCGPHDRLLGGEGNDDLDGLAGADEVLGEAGDDLTAGGDGTDTVVGGAGKDKLTGGHGADALDARDGLAGESVSCGGQADTATVDGSDTVFPDCETTSWMMAR